MRLEDGTTARLFRFQVAWLVILWLWALLGGPAYAQGQAISGRVVRVIDGDTVTLRDEHRRMHRIRLSGIDAPECGMRYGHESKLYLEGFVLTKDAVVSSRGLDRYGRTLGAVMVGTIDINLAMVEAGMAWHYKQTSTKQSTIGFVVLARAEQQARVRRIGLWEAEMPVAPWDWRLDNRAHRSVGCSASLEIVTAGACGQSTSGNHGHRCVAQAAADHGPQLP